MLENGNRPAQVQNEILENTSFATISDRDLVLAIMARANEIARNPDGNAMIQGMIDLMMEISLADSANFFQLDTATDEFVLTHVRSEVECKHLVGLRFKRQQGLPGLTFCDTKIGVVGDLPAEFDWMHVIGPLNAPRKQNVINLPLINNDNPLGVIQVYNYQKAELDLLTVLCDRLAQEMDARKEADATRRSNQRLMTLFDMFGEVAGALDRNQILRLVTENASQLVGAERSSIFLVDPETREMIFQVAYQSPYPIGTPSSANKGEIRGTNKIYPRLRVAASRSPSSEFSYFNHSTITVPLRSEPSSSDPADEAHILGGLMVINKQSATFQEEDAQLMQLLATQASISLQVAEMYESSEELFFGVIKALATAIDAKDPYTQGHSQRVSDYSVQIAQELGMDETFINDLRVGSLFHDIGKIGIPDAILLKNSRLDDHEREVIRLHPRMGVNILSQVKLLEPMIPAIVEHHERLDGSGYPARLAGEQISMMGRIVAVADVYDAMTSSRPYRMGLGQQDVLAYLYENAGILFDENCVAALAQSLNRQDLF